MKRCDRQRSGNKNNLSIAGSLCLCYFATTAPICAQIVPDATLPNNSVINIDRQTTRITGGTPSGSSLFHSFSEFSIPTGNAAYFDQSPQIQNIFSRVTGGSISNIDGLIQANGSANLFLLNPNGIVFGPNVRLNIGGSFFATTSDRVVFDNGTFFSATNPEAPPLLTVNVPIGLQFGGNSGNIVVRGEGLNRGFLPEDATAQERVESEIQFQTEVLNRPVGLEVLPGRTLALIGGDVTLNGGQIAAPGGRIELTSVANGTVQIDRNEGQFAIAPPLTAELGTIQLLGESGAIATSMEGSGDIQAIARRVSVSDGSEIRADTLSSQPAGTVTIIASESVQILGTSPDGESRTVIGAATFGDADAGTVDIITQQLIVQDGGWITVGTDRQGEAGAISIRASDSVELIGTSENGVFPSIVDASTSTAGNASNVEIETQRLIVRDGAQVRVRSLGEGRAGNLTIRATESVEVSGTSPDGTFLSLLQASTFGTGDAGNITLETGQLRVRDGGSIEVLTEARGNAGTLRIDATESVEVSGTSPDGQFPTLIGAKTFGTGNAGSVTVNTGRLLVLDGAEIGVSTSASGQAGQIALNVSDAIAVSGISQTGDLPTRVTAETQGSGNAGDVTIATRQLTIREGGQILLSTSDSGKAGNLTVRASESVDLSGTSRDRPEGSFRSLLVATTSGMGDAGTIAIETGHLTIRDGAEIGVVTSGDGNAGTIALRASESMELRGISANGQLQTLLTAETVGPGNAGDVAIATPQLIVRNGAQIVVGTSGTGQAGSLTVNASESVELSGTSANGLFPTRLTAETLGAGTAGNVTIATDRFSIRDRAEVSVNGQATGTPGSIAITASDLDLDGGALRATSATGKGGNINLRSRDILLRNTSQISAAGSQNGNLTQEGNININAETLVLLEDSSIITSAADPQGGSNIAIAPLQGSDLVVFQSPDSTINARGQLNIEEDLEFDPASLPDVEVTNTREAIAATCSEIEGSSFVITGRGGLPPSPRDILTGDRPLVDLASPTEEFQHPTSNIKLPRRGDRPTPLVEATGWVIAADGQVILTAPRATASSAHLGLTPPPCPVLTSK